MGGSSQSQERPWGETMAVTIEQSQEVSSSSSSSSVVGDDEYWCKPLSMEETFECGKMWQLLHQNILLLLHQRGQKMFGGKYPGSTEMGRLHNNWSSAGGRQDVWLEDWNDQAVRHLKDSTELFKCMLGEEGPALKKVKRFHLVQGGPQILHWFDLLEENIEVLVKLSQFYGMDRMFVEQKVQFLLKSVSDLRNELNETFCSGTCRTDYLLHGWKDLIVGYLDNMVGIHFLLLQACCGGVWETGHL